VWFAQHPTTRIARPDQVTVLVGYALLTNRVPAVPTVLVDLAAVHGVLRADQEEPSAVLDGAKTGVCVVN
jgi:hypothetical protein